MSDKWKVNNNVNFVQLLLLPVVVRVTRIHVIYKEKILMISFKAIGTSPRTQYIHACKPSQ